MLLELKGIVMVASDRERRSDDVTLDIGDGQDIGRLGSFASLVGHRLAPFLGDGMTTIEVEFRQIQPVLDRADACLPYLFQAAIPAPLAKMVVHGIMADLFFSGSSGSGPIGKRYH